MRIGLIGAGPWGRNYIKALAESPLNKMGRLTVLCSSNEDAKNWVDDSCTVLSHWEELFQGKHAELDALIIASPPEVHARMLELALKSSLPCMIEKPLTLDLQEAKNLGDLADSASTPVPVLVNHIQLFHPGFEELKRRIPDPSQILEIHSEAGNSGPFRTYSALWDYGPHDLAMAISLLGTLPDGIQARRMPVDPKVLAEHPTGAVFEVCLGHKVVIQVGNLLKAKTRRLTVRTKDQTFVLDALASDPTKKLTVNGQPIPIDQTPPLTRAIETFLTGIGGKDAPERDERFGLKLAIQVINIISECERQLKP